MRKPARKGYRLSDRFTVLRVPGRDDPPTVNRHRLYKECGQQDCMMHTVALRKVLDFTLSVL